jgi:uncharacterized membrane protein
MKTELYREGVTSTAAVAGHPIHPVLVPFPIAFLVGTLLTDLAYAAGGNDVFWARASLWLVGAGVVGGLLAALFGLVDFFTIRRARAHRWGWVHFGGNAVVLVLSAINLLLRLGNPADAVLPLGLTLSLIVAVILLVTGWAGGELAYRYKIGVTGDGQTEDERLPENVTTRLR